jgi:hypothetical protein
MARVVVRFLTTRTTPVLRLASGKQRLLALRIACTGARFNC